MPKSVSQKIQDPVEKVRKAKQISQLEHAKRKSMWVGSKKYSNHRNILPNARHRYITAMYDIRKNKICTCVVQNNR